MDDDTPHAASGPGTDSELELAMAELLKADTDGKRFAAALRRSFDMLLDGQHTGRFRWEELYKTEKTHCGTVVEINLQREFDFAGGTDLDYRIAGTDVDCKYSQQMGGWMIPPEAVGKLCLILWANDKQGKWCAGLVRALPEHLNEGSNRDSKKTLNKAGRSTVRWLFKDAPLPENVLLRLPARDIEAIFSPSSGQTRVNELFRRAQGKLISRNAVATVAQQEDYMKRVRNNQGARGRLREEGIIILGQYRKHTAIAEELGLPVPGRGEFTSGRVVRVPEGSSRSCCSVIDGQRWALASENDPVEPAPELPRV
ncbi:restriction endonuclease [Nocardiopsis sp. TSRI0078]|nr:restriction endonuclease [Nocardiopsis sp. TSRI0078]